MGDVAIRIGELLNYENAGTVEFVFDVSTGKFYFLEVNTRLQVEHPITEEVTRLDIVSLQLFIAGGGDLTTLEPLQQIDPIGHAIECRLCAENPQRDFYPEHGVIRLWEPAAGYRRLSDTSAVRFETGITTGSRISIHFDSMIAKIVVWEPTRSLARATMIKVLAETACIGVGTNQLFLQSCLLHESFSNPAYTTSFIPDNLASLLKSPYYLGTSDILSGLALLVSFVLSTVMKPEVSKNPSPFSNIRSGFRNQSFDSVNHANRRVVVLDDDATGKASLVCAWNKSGNEGQVRINNGTIATLPQANSASVTARYNELSNSLRQNGLPNQQSYDISVNSYDIHLVKPLTRSCPSWYEASVYTTMNGKRYLVRLTTESNDIGQGGISQTAKGVRAMCHVPQLGTWIDMTCFSVLSYFENIRENVADVSGQKLRHINAPMPCKVLSVLTNDGEIVKSGDKIMVVESMKMEINIFASVDGSFKPKVKEGDAVDEGRALCLIE
jgi:acetyl/propionyl-CoA carboxylase alpha subunit